MQPAKKCFFLEKINRLKKRKQLGSKKIFDFLLTIRYNLHLLQSTLSLWCQKSFSLTVSLACGATSSQNSTYLVKTDVATLQAPCIYTICPTANSICRIRLDFTVISLYIFWLSEIF
jgi:hypothetical protein